MKYKTIHRDDYYPFGLAINALSYQKQSALDNDYLYNGKELQDEHNLGWLDYGARMYMPDIGRWGVIDPISELGRRWSPYGYALNNPIRFIDPDGMYSEEFQKHDLEWGFSYLTLCDGCNFNESGQSNTSNATTNNSTAKANSFIKNLQDWSNKFQQKNKKIFGGDGPGDGNYPWYHFFADGNPGGDFLYEINKWNPLANAYNAISSYARGEDSYGVRQTNTDATIQLASAIPIGKIVVGGSLIWAGTTKVSKGLMNWKILGNASRGTLVSTALAGTILHKLGGNPTVSQMTLGLMKRWPTTLGPSAPSLGTFIGRNTAAVGVGTAGWGVYEIWDND